MSIKHFGRRPAFVYEIAVGESSGRTAFYRNGMKQWITERTTKAPQLIHNGSKP